MTKLRAALQDYKQRVTLGDGNAPMPPANELRARLQQIIRQSSVYLWICVALVVILFAIAMIVVLANLGQPVVVQVVFAGITGSTTGAIYFMRSLWREKVATEIVIAFSDAFEGEALRTILEVFIHQLRGSPKGR